MRFDEPSQSLVVDDDFCLPAKFFINEHSEHPMVTMPGGVLVHDTRVMRCYFENRWGMSIIWGSMTYSTNYDHPWGLRGNHHEFVEEPDTVEVGIIMPDKAIRPAQKIDLPGWKGPSEFPEYEFDLWGDPLGYVDAAGVRFLVGMVSRFDSHTWPMLEDGPYLEPDDSGRLHLNFTPKGTPCDDSTQTGSQP
jgi:hypothetical protein